jgi:hypothetical protein
MKYFRVTLSGIKWDIDGEGSAADLELPNNWETIIEAEDGDTEDDVYEEAVDSLSDNFGWTTLGFGNTTCVEVKKVTVTYSAQFEADIYVEGTEDIQDRVSDIDIPEGGSNNSRYVPDSFDPLKTEGDD